MQRSGCQFATVGQQRRGQEPAEDQAAQQAADVTGIRDDRVEQAQGQRVRRPYRQYDGHAMVTKLDPLPMGDDRVEQCPRRVRRSPRSADGGIVVPIASSDPVAQAAT